jgi:peptidoglycan/LPS O-acetylase OafA/YrhL
LNSNLNNITRFHFLPELDALRALAIFMTLYAHYVPETSVFYFPNMWYGVDIFFTISGFLITAILLNSVNNSLPKLEILKNFFIKRALRLFPLYYAFILFFFLAYHFFNLYMWKPEYEPYFFTYFQNWYFFKVGSFDSHFSHLWSLGVEEQFYMVWPFLIIFSPKKLLPGLFLLLVLLAISLNAYYHKIPLFRNLTFSNFHTLGIGSLFAYYYVYRPQWKLFDVIVKNKNLFAVLAVIVFVLFLYANVEFSQMLTEFIKEILLAIFCLAVLIPSIYGWFNPISILTKSKPIKYIGKISYGIYLFHLPLPALYVLLCTRINMEEAIPKSTAVAFILYSTLSIVVASLSYYLFELNFLRLKSKFQ